MGVGFGAARRGAAIDANGVEDGDEGRHGTGVTRGRRQGQADGPAGAASPFAPRIRAAARATGVASVFALSALAGFGTGPTATRPAETATDFMPRPYAMSYAVREAVAQARANRQFAGVVEALDARGGLAEPIAPVPVVAYGPAGAESQGDALDRFDAFVGGTLALGGEASGDGDGFDLPVPTMRPTTRTTMRPATLTTMRPVGPDASGP